MNSAIYWGHLMHNRIRPKKHRFLYRLASWLIDLDELAELDKKLWLFSFNRFNLIAFHSQDYGNGSGHCLKEQITKLLETEQCPAPDRIALLCSPRVFGYVFNPLSVYFCYQKNDLVALVYEVSNTFGERHSYVIPVSGADTDFIHQATEKRLHVSPFFPMECEYRFRTRKPGNDLSLAIELLNQKGKLFSAVFKGQHKPLNNVQTIQQLCLLPWQTLKVIVAIHWEALRLWLKGIKIITHRPAQQPYSWSSGAPLTAHKNNNKFKYRD